MMRHFRKWSSLIAVCAAAAIVSLACSRDGKREEITPPEITLAGGEFSFTNRDTRPLTGLYALFSYAGRTYLFGHGLPRGSRDSPVAGWGIFLERGVLGADEAVRQRADLWIREEEGWSFELPVDVPFPIDLSPDSLIAIVTVSDSLIGVFQYLRRGATEYEVLDGFIGSQYDIRRPATSDKMKQYSAAFLKILDKNREWNQRRALAEAAPMAIPEIRFGNGMLSVRNTDVRRWDDPPWVELCQAGKRYAFMPYSASIKALLRDGAADLRLAELRSYPPRIPPDSVSISAEMQDGTWHMYTLTLGTEGLYNVIQTRLHR